MRKIMQDISMRWIGVSIHVSTWRQIAIAISRQYYREHLFEEYRFIAQEIEQMIEDDNLWDLQSGHGTHVAGIIYARELIEGQSIVATKREQFRSISQV